MGLDVTTPRGLESVAQEVRLLKAVEAQYPVRVIPTPKDGAATVDGVLVIGDTLAGVFESKCRNMTLRTLREDFGNEWLVTHDKLLGAAQAARLLGVPLFGFVYLVPDDVGLAIRLANAEGFLIPRIRVITTETQATINGGTARRRNAYVKMDTAVEFRVPPT